MDEPPVSALRARTGIAPKLIEGPRVGQQSLYRQRILDVRSLSQLS
jgi:protein DGCR14